MSRGKSILDNFYQDEHSYVPATYDSKHGLLKLVVWEV